MWINIYWYRHYIDIVLFNLWIASSRNLSPALQAHTGDVVLPSALTSPAPLSPLSSPHLLLLPNLSLYPDPLPSTSLQHTHKKLNRRALASGWLHISTKPSLEPSSVPLLRQLLMNRVREESTCIYKNLMCDAGAFRNLETSFEILEPPKVS